MPSPLMLTGLDQVRGKWGWFVALGVALALIGTVALSANALTTLVTIIILGWMLIFTGVIEAISAFNVRDWGGFLFHLLGAVLDVVLGVMFLVRPVEGAMILTVLLACFFFVSGAFRIVGSLLAKYPGWGWSLLSGAINVVLGVLLIKQWPYDGLWFIGFCVALELIFRGWFWIMLGLGIKNLPKAGV